MMTTSFDYSDLLQLFKITFDDIFVSVAAPWYPLLVKTEERFWKALPILWYSFGKAVKGETRDALCE